MLDVSTNRDGRSDMPDSSKIQSITTLSPGNHSREVTFGSVFHESSGKLYLFRPGSHILVMRAWPRPQAWILTLGKAWRGCHPSFHLPKGVSIQEELAHVETKLHPVTLSEVPVPDLPYLLQYQANLRLANTVPARVRAAITGLPSEHWHLLRLAAAGGDPALDLMHGTPALAVALASARRFRPIEQPLRAARSLLARGRSLADIARWLGFPGTPATIRMLRKVAPGGLSAVVLRHVRRILLDPSLHQRAAHLPVLSRPCIRVLSDPFLEGAVDQTFLHALAEESDLGGVWMLKDILAMRGVLETPGATLPRIRRMQDLHRLHDTLMERLQDEDLGDTPLPIAPAPGTETICPIETTEALQAEGRRMHHCVASLLPKILQGHAAVYRVHKPERCTMSLRRRQGPNSEWVLDQVKLAHNREPSRETLWTLKNWFDNTPFLLGVAEERSGSEEEEVWTDVIPF